MEMNKSLNLDKNFVARRIKIARKKAGLTQEELADKVGITSKQLSRIELATYMPSLPTFLKIIMLLKINIQDFGVELVEERNQTKLELQNFINNATPAELEFYLNCVKTMKDSFGLIKKEKYSL